MEDCAISGADAGRIMKSVNAFMGNKQKWLIFYV